MSRSLLRGIRVFRSRPPRHPCKAVRYSALPEQQRCTNPRSERALRERFQGGEIALGNKQSFPMFPDSAHRQRFRNFFVRELLESDDRRQSDAWYTARGNPIANEILHERERRKQFLFEKNVFDGAQVTPHGYDCSIKRPLNEISAEILVSILVASIQADTATQSLPEMNKLNERKFGRSGATCFSVRNTPKRTAKDIRLHRYLFATVVMKTDGRTFNSSATIISDRCVVHFLERLCRARGLASKVGRNHSMQTFLEGHDIGSGIISELHPKFSERRERLQMGAHDARKIHKMA